jgi:endonuclease III
MNAATIRAIFERLREARPDPRSELLHHTPYELLVAVVLSAQATDKSVNKATEKLFPVANTPQAMVRLGVDGLIPYINAIGLFRNKARNVVGLSEVLLRDHGGEVPANRAALESLPGVGSKSAGVVLNVAFGQPTIPVDTHIFRVANRTGLARGKVPDEISQQLERIVPDEFRHDAHHWLILHGRYVCIARRPMCPQCPIRAWCEYREKTPAEPVIDVESLTGAKPGRRPGARSAATRPVPPKATVARRGVQPLAKTARAGSSPRGGRKR